ncbi:Hypothetical predicted protein [Xyrichtys novacula]|uniref:Uncharacterized protein n=1 Tax=Xyrichtys novacula TaxID=13765 RepID=A0AAV1FAH6_XYRNO|nr:Hypothetical predicted protein [Xyrichtys novacula]
MESLEPGEEMWRPGVESLEPGEEMWSAWSPGRTSFLRGTASFPDSTFLTADSHTGGYFVFGPDALGTDPVLPVASPAGTAITCGALGCWLAEPFLSCPARPHRCP